MVRVVFLCTENSNRSQMAEAFARHHGERLLGAGALEAWSAGSEPSGQVNPKAVRAMAGRGIDLSTHRSKSTHELPHQRFDVVVTMGCGDQCPWLAGDAREDWGLPDPRHMEGDEFTAVRDEIERRVVDLVERLRRR